MKKSRIIIAAVLSVALATAVFAKSRKSSSSNNEPPAKPEWGEPPEGTPPDGTPPDGMPGDFNEDNSSSTEAVVVEGADSITYTYTSTKNVTKTYYAKYLVD